MKEQEQPEKDARRPYVVGLMVGLVLLAVTVVIAKTQEFSGAQLAIFRAFNNLPDGLTLPALWITEGLGAAYAMVACVVIAALYKRYRLAWRFAVVSVGA